MKTANIRQFASSNLSLYITVTQLHWTQIQYVGGCYVYSLYIPGNKFVLYTDGCCFKAGVDSCYHSSFTLDMKVILPLAVQ